MFEGSERRGTVRADFISKIKITRKDTNEDTFCFTKNIGIGGICAAVNKDLGIFSEVTLEISLKEETFDPVVCQGRVVWVIKRSEKDKFGQDVYDTGFEFINISKKCQERINKLIEQWRAKTEFSE